MRIWFSGPRTLAVLGAALLAAQCAQAKPLHQIPSPESDDCLMSDNRGPDHDGEAFCLKDGTGMTQEQIDAWYHGAEYLDKVKKNIAEQDARDKETAARNAKLAEPVFSNCSREFERAKHLNGEWVGPPSRADCVAYIEKIKDAVSHQIDKDFQGILENK